MFCSENMVINTLMGFKRVRKKYHSWRTTLGSMFPKDTDKVSLPVGKHQENVALWNQKDSSVRIALSKEPKTTSYHSPKTNNKP